eukprot:scaffold45428_cov67-Phaeocystis_antarctica.AAC.1
MEFNASGLVKGNKALISLKGLTGKEKHLSEVCENGKAAREPPVAPAAFASTLEAGVASGETKFTNSGDVGLVGKIYGWAFAAEMAGAVALYYADLGWDDAQVLALFAALRAAHAGGGLRKLETLNLGGKNMSDGALAALVALLEEGAMPNLKLLLLHKNQISDAGVAALASALRGGTLPSCTKIGLGGNPGGEAPVEEALALRQDVATAVELSYAGCDWDDAQMLTLCEALRTAHAGGGLTKLEELDLRLNKMGDGAMAALAALLEEGAMPNLKKLDLRWNQISDAGVAALAAALRGGAMPSWQYMGIRLDDNPGAIGADEDEEEGSCPAVEELLASHERAAALARRQEELSA